MMPDAIDMDMYRQKRSLKDGNGDGTFDGMEARVAKLEAHVEHIRDDLGKLAGVPIDLATLKTRVDHLPSKGFIVTVITAGVAAIGALVTFAEKIQALVG